MSTLSYIREEQLRKLKGAIDGNISVYLSETPSENDFPEINDTSLRRSSIPIDENIARHIQMPVADDSKDSENCIAVYESLKNLTPQQATDERVWVYFTHCELREYVQRRWPLNKKDPKKTASGILTHYFVSGVRGLSRDNAVSRLWWMGRVASRCSHFDTQKTLEILLHQSDVRANLLERSSFAMSPEIFNATMMWLGKSYEGEKILFQREKFRQLMKHLNRRGGRVVLNALKESQLNRLITEILESDLSLDPSAL